IQGECKCQGGLECLPSGKRGNMPCTVIVEIEYFYIKTGLAVAFPCTPSQFITVAGHLKQPDIGNMQDAVQVVGQYKPLKRNFLLILSGHSIHQLNQFIDLTEFSLMFLCKITDRKSVA